jgi:acetyl-CoA synthetase
MVPEILSILYGCFKAGLTVVPIFAGFGAGAIATRLEDSGARVLFTARISSGAANSSRCSKKCRRACALILVGADPLFAGQPEEAPTLSLESEARAFILYTSGTTGKAQGRGPHARRMPGADGQGNLAGFRPSARTTASSGSPTSAG